MALLFKNRPSLVAYLTCGDPDLATSRDIALAAIDAGADILELGVPFSDPVADGPVIQRASERALRHGTTLQQVLALAKDIRRRSQAGVIIFTYLNPIMRIGFAKFSAAVADAGIDGALIIDLPVEEVSKLFVGDAHKRVGNGISGGSDQHDQRLKRIAGVSSGFVYAVSRTGVTGARQKLAEDASSLVRRLRKYTKLPVAVGFGISTAEQFTAVGEFADAAVVGSAIVQTIERNPGKEAESVAQFVRQLSAISRQPSATR